MVVGGSRGAAVAELAQREAGAEGQGQHRLAVFLHAEARSTIQQHMRAKCYNNSPTVVKQRNSGRGSRRTPLPCVSSVLPHRLVLPDLQLAHAPHSGM